MNTTSSGGFKEAFLLMRVYMASQMVMSACGLGIFEKIGHESLSSDELAVALGLPRQNLSRFMRGLVLCHAVRESGGNEYALTDVGKCFLRDAENSLYGFAMQNLYFYAAWGQLTEALRTGKSGFELAYGKRIFDFLGDSPGLEHWFNASMHTNTELIARSICSLYDFTPFTEVVDVGGSTGILGRHIKRRCPHLRVVNFDRASVIDDARAGDSAGVEHVPGNFFVAVPPTSGVYILSHVLHDWDDEDCIRILDKCGQQMDAGNKMLIIEQLLPEKVESYHPAVEFDMNMFVISGGKERTEGEYADLLLRSGLKLLGKKVLYNGNYLLEVSAE